MSSFILKGQKLFFGFMMNHLMQMWYLLCDIPFIFCICYRPLTVRVEFAVSFPLCFQGSQNDQMWKNLLHVFSSKFVCAITLPD